MLELLAPEGSLSIEPHSGPESISLYQAQVDDLRKAVSRQEVVLGEERPVRP